MGSGPKLSPSEQDLADAVLARNQNPPAVPSAMDSNYLNVIDPSSGVFTLNPTQNAGTAGVSIVNPINNLLTTTPTLDPLVAKQKRTTLLIFAAVGGFAFYFFKKGKK